MIRENAMEIIEKALDAAKCGVELGYINHLPAFGYVRGLADMAYKSGIITQADCVHYIKEIEKLSKGAE